jgi:ornithine cyclodeaminase
MALLLRESDVEKLLTMQDAMDLVEKVHREYSMGQASDVPRERTRMPRAALQILQGAVPSAGVFGYKAYTTGPEGARFLVHAFDAANGRLLGVIEADRLGMMRTGAIGGVAAKWLARKDAEVVGMFGSGWQAHGQLEALARARKITRVKVYSRTRDRLERFCGEMREKLSLDVVPAASAEDAVRGSDIVVTITKSATPVFSGEWLAPGTHVNAAGSNSLVRREIDERTVLMASRIVVDSRATALKEAGDLLPALDQGRIGAGALAEIGEVIAGIRPGRTAPDEVTLFESQGMAIQDLAIAAHLLRLASDRGAGMPLELGG